MDLAVKFEEIKNEIVKKGLFKDQQKDLKRKISFLIFFMKYYVCDE